MYCFFKLISFLKTSIKLSVVSAEKAAKYLMNSKKKTRGVLKEKLILSSTDNEKYFPKYSSLKSRCQRFSTRITYGYPMRSQYLHKFANKTGFWKPFVTGSIGYLASFSVAISVQSNLIFLDKNHSL